MSSWELTYFSITKFHYNKLISEVPKISLYWYSTVLIKSQQNWWRQGIEQFAVRSINLLIVWGIRRLCLRSGRSWSLYLSIRRALKQTVYNYSGISCCLPTMYKILSNIVLSRITPYAEEIIGDHQCGFWCNRSTTDRIQYFVFVKCLKKKLGIHWSSTSAVYRLQDSLSFS